MKFNLHKSFKIERKRTTLSDHVWKFKNKQKTSTSTSNGMS